MAKTSIINKNSLPHQTLARLLQGPYLHAHVSSSAGVRSNGRSHQESRVPAVNISSLSHCSGSAVVRAGDVAVVCGIRAEILDVQDITDPSALRRNALLASHDTQEDLINQLNLLVPNVELSTGCSPAHLPGSPPSATAQTLTYQILRLLLSTKLISLQDLAILHSPTTTQAQSQGDPEGPIGPEVKGIWTLHISFQVLSLSGPPLPFLWYVMLAALRDLLLPAAWWDQDLGKIICSDSIDQARQLNLRREPLVTCWGVFRTPLSILHGNSDVRTHSILADPDGFEEELCEEFITVVIDGGKDQHVRVLQIDKVGGGDLGGRNVLKLMHLAGQQWREWQQILDRACVRSI